MFLTTNDTVKGVLDAPVFLKHLCFFVSSPSFCQSRRLFPFFLLPAQGLCHGDVELDAWSVRHCASEGLELLCAQSFSHTFGLYGETLQWQSMGVRWLSG